MIKKLSKSGGFTLIEIIIVLAIIGMLAGILAPTMVKYVQSAKLRRATLDVKTIGTAIGSFYNDLGEWPVWRAGNAMTGNGDIGTAWSILKFGPIDTAGAMAASAVDPAVGGTGWVLAAGTDYTSGAKHLWANDPDADGVLTTTPYPNLVDTPTLRYAWRGPYMEQFRADPWGNNYLCNVVQLWPVNETGNAACYVISAGPDKTLDTNYTQSGPTLDVGDDDIIFRIK